MTGEAVDVRLMSRSQSLLGVMGGALMAEGVAEVLQIGASLDVELVAMAVEVRNTAEVSAWLVI